MANENPGIPKQKFYTPCPGSEPVVALPGDHPLIDFMFKNRNLVLDRIQVLRRELVNLQDLASSLTPTEVAINGDL